MIYQRKATDRGGANFGWLDSKHSFSFGHYYDPKHMGFSALRVINDDTVSPGAGFDTHGHRDMEIISYVTKGAIEHKDSMGNSFVVPAGEIQRMSAGTGITHSEFNHSQSEELKFLQIWIIPNEQGIEPSYEQKAIEQTSQLTPLVTPIGKDGSLTMHQDASIYRLALEPGKSINLDAIQRPGYLHVIEGEATTTASNDKAVIISGGGIGVFEEKLTLTAENQSLIALWFDLPAPTKESQS